MLGSLDDSRSGWFVYQQDMSSVNLPGPMYSTSKRAFSQQESSHTGGLVHWVHSGTQGAEKLLRIYSP